MSTGTTRDDDLVRLYHEAAELDETGPSPVVGDAVRAHARMLAAARAQTGEPQTLERAGRDTPANATRWRVSMLGSLAVVGLVGLLIVQFDRGTPQEQQLARGPDVASLPAADAPVAAAKESTTPMAPQIAGRTQRRDAGKDLADSAAVMESAANTEPSASVPQDAAAGLPPSPLMRKSDTGQAQADVAADREEAARAPMAAPGALSASGTATGELRSRLAAKSPARIGPETDLHRLAAAGHWPELAQRLAAGAAVDARDPQGRTPLMRAAGAGQREVVQGLLAAGADPRLTDSAGNTASRWAQQAGWPDIARLLDDTPRRSDASR